MKITELIKTLTLGVLFTIGVVLTGCESSGSDAKVDNANDNSADDFVLKDWDQIDNSLENVTGKNTIIKAKSYKDYLFSDVMETNRLVGEALYVNKLMERIEKPDSNPLIDVRWWLFGDEYDDVIEEPGFFDKERYNTGFTRYKKQAKCITDLHQRELEINSLVAAYHNKNIRKDLFDESYLNSSEAEVLDELWQEDGDFIQLFESYRKQLVASLTAPFLDDEEKLDYNLWNCGISPAALFEFNESNFDKETNLNEFTFIKNMVDKISEWNDGNSPINRETLPDVLYEMKVMVNEAKEFFEGKNFPENNIGQKHREIIFDFYVKPKSNIKELADCDGVDCLDADENGKSELGSTDIIFAQGTLDRLNKLLCRGYLTGEQPEAELCDGYIYPKYQTDRNINEQLASNIEEMLRNSILKISLAESLRFEKIFQEGQGVTPPYISRAKDSNRQLRTISEEFNRIAYTNKIRDIAVRKDLVPSIDKLREHLGTVMQRNGTDCKSNNACISSILVSTEFDGSPVEPEKKLPAELGNTEEHKNTFHKDRINYVMKNFNVLFIDEYYAKIYEAEEAAGAWNHLIILLLITFGGLRLRSRRLA